MKRPVAPGKYAVRAEFESYIDQLERYTLYLEGKLAGYETVLNNGKVKTPPMDQPLLDLVNSLIGNKK